MKHNTAGISVVVPFLNEEEGILGFCSVFEQYAASAQFPLELVFVDDGSSDRTCEHIQSYSFKACHSVKLVKLSKNYGSHAAIRAGLQKASFDICTWMGSDLQEPIGMLEQSYQLLSDGCDAVYIEKKSIAIGKTSRFFSRAYSYLMQKYAVKNYSSGGISTIVFGKKIKDLINENVEGNSSIMLQIMDMGFSYKVLSLDFHERATGVSKWTFSKKIKLFIDSFVAFSFAPIRLVSFIGVLFFLFGFAMGIVTLVNRFSNPDVPMGYSTLVSIMSIGFGITNISLGIIAEYLWRTYDAARRRPVFTIEDYIDIKPLADSK